MQSKLNIKSNIRNYQVEFTQDYLKIIKKYNLKDNFFIIDKNIFKKFIKKKVKIKNLKIISSNETTKQYDYTNNLLNYFKDQKINKKTTIILVGGGSLQDLISFVCSIFHRGINWIFLPTTLLSQADSCIGGKNSINFNKYKNIIGNFNPPYKIYISNRFLLNLPKKNLYDGLGEIFHILAVYNKKKILLIEKFLQKKISIDYLIRESLLCKKYFIEKDEFDKDTRKLLNFGHTFGHAIEGYTNYKISHGQAVAIGCLYALWMSLKLKYISLDQFNYYKKLLNNIILNKRKINISNLSNYLLKDKKAEKNNVNFILVNKNYKMFIKKVRIDNKFIKIFNNFSY